MLVAPTLDRYARIADVRSEVEEARKAWRLSGKEEALTFSTPVDFNRFHRKTQEQILSWFGRN
jgi:hypothetical protein